MIKLIITFIDGSQTEITPVSPMKALPFSEGWLTFWNPQGEIVAGFQAEKVVSFTFQTVKVN